MLTGSEMNLALSGNVGAYVLEVDGSPVSDADLTNAGVTSIKVRGNGNANILDVSGVTDLPVKFTTDATGGADTFIGTDKGDTFAPFGTLGNDDTYVGGEGEDVLIPANFNNLVTSNLDPAAYAQTFPLTPPTATLVGVEVIESATPADWNIFTNSDAGGDYLDFSGVTLKNIRDVSLGWFADTVITAAGHEGAVTTYIGGQGPSTAPEADAIYINLSLEQYLGLSEADQAALDDYVADPTGKMLDLGDSLGFKAKQFEQASILVTYDGVVIDPAWLDLKQVNGTDGDDVIKFPQTGNKAELVFAGAGNDYIEANGGNDVVFGEEGDDTMWGGTGDDTLFGGAGDDTFLVFGSWEKGETFDGGEGTDTVRSRLGTMVFDNIDSSDLDLGGALVGKTAEFNSIEVLEGAAYLNPTFFSSSSVSGNNSANYFDFSSMELSNIGLVNLAGGDDTVVVGKSHTGAVLTEYSGGNGNDTMYYDASIYTIQITGTNGFGQYGVGLDADGNLAFKFSGMDAIAELVA